LRDLEAHRRRLLRDPEMPAAHLVNLPGGDEDCIQAELGLIDEGGFVARRAGGSEAVSAGVV